MRGATLIEVLIAIVIVTFGLLGSMGLILTSMRATNQTGIYSQATNLAREFAERARANRSVARITSAASNPYLLTTSQNADGSTTGWPTAPAASATCITNVCTPQQVAAWDVWEWSQRVQAALPQARVVTCFDADPTDSAGAFRWACTPGTAGTLVVKIGWASRQNTGQIDETGGNATTRIPRVVIPAIPGVN
jgi:type IV pilus assembly protein PilV